MKLALLAVDNMEASKELDLGSQELSLVTE